MGRILVVNHVSLDGVMQGPGRADEDTRDGFDLGGWGVDDETAGHVMGERLGVGGGQAGWLFGRRTYEDLLTHWTAQPDRSFGEALLGSQKYVVSRTLSDPPPWPNTTPITGDVVAHLSALKEQLTGTLTVMGSGQLIDTLLPAGLIDEFLLFINPLVLGRGHRLFASGSPSVPMRRTHVQATDGGLVVISYEPVSSE